MIFTIKQFPDKKFTDKMDQTRFIKKNREDLFIAKGLEYKTESECVIKAEINTNSFVPNIAADLGDIIEVKALINSTNVIDSHRDLHLNGIWNKTVNDNRFTPILKCHERIFESVIANKGKNYNEQMNFKDIGVDVDFEFQANISQFFIDKNSQPLMWSKYANGEVMQHSIGMMYVDYDIAYYDEDSEKEMNFFNEMKKQAINPEVADEYGYIWVVREAKKREGSAVVFGSNPLTPTLWIKNYEPQRSTREKTEPSYIGTQDKSINKFINPNLF